METADDWVRCRNKRNILKGGGNVDASVDEINDNGGDDRYADGEQKKQGPARCEDDCRSMRMRMADQGHHGGIYLK
jgi:hypothetical protein